jgi:ketosteroid isomerase-like protein
MNHPNIDLVAGVYGAYLSGDRDAVLAALAPDVVWRNSGPDAEEQAARGPAAVLDHLLGEDHMDDYQLDVVDMLASDDRVAIVARTSGRRGDARIVNDFVQVVTLRDGLVSDVRNFYWDPAGVAAFLEIPREPASATT